MYQQHNNQITRNMLHQPQYYSNNYQKTHHQNYNHNVQFSNAAHNQSQVSKFTAQQHWNQQQQQQLRHQLDYQTAAQSLQNISQDTGAVSIPSGHYQQNQQYQQSVERQHQPQQTITPPPLDRRVGQALMNQYSIPINTFQSQGQRTQLQENNQYLSSPQFQYPSTSYSHHSTIVDQRFPTWTNTKLNTQTNVSNSVSSQLTVSPSLSVDSTNSTGSMSSWHRPSQKQQVLLPQQSVQSHSTIDSRYYASCSTSSSMPVLQHIDEAEKNPPDLTNLISYLKESSPSVKICPNTTNLSIDENISVKKISQQEVRRQEAPLRDLKKMYRLEKQSENSDVFRKPKEKYKPTQCSETLNSVSPKHRMASPDSTLLPDISKTIVSNEPSLVSDDKCEPPLSPVSDSDATVCYGKDEDDDESLKRRCQDFDSPVQEMKPVSLKRRFNDGDVEYENIEKRIKMISPSEECDSTNEFVEEQLRNNCQDRLTPSVPDPSVGCVVYNNTFNVRYLLRDHNKYYLLNDIRPFLKQFKPLLRDIKPIQTYATCTETEEKQLNWKYSSHFSFGVTSNMKFVAFETNPEIHCPSISVQELHDNENTVSEIISDKHISAQELTHNSDLTLDNTANVVNQTNHENEQQTSPLTSTTLKNELDKLSGMAQEIIHSAFASLLEECRSLQDKNQKLTEEVQLKDEKLQFYEDLLREASSLM